MNEDYADLRKRLRAIPHRMNGWPEEVIEAADAIDALVKERDAEKAAAVDAMHHATKAIRERDAALARVEKLEAALRDARFVIIGVGEFIPDKDYDEVIAAIDAAIAEEPKE